MLNRVLLLLLPLSGGTLDLVRHNAFRLSLMGLVSVLLFDRGTLRDFPWIILRPPVALLPASPVLAQLLACRCRAAYSDSRSVTDFCGRLPRSGW